MRKTPDEHEIHSPDDTDSDLNQRVNQRFKGASLTAGLDDFLLIATTGQDKTPKVQTVHKLPVVYRSESFLVGLTTSHDASQVNSKHTNVTEGVRV